METPLASSLPADLCQIGWARIWEEESSVFSPVCSDTRPSSHQVSDRPPRPAPNEAQKSINHLPVDPLSIQQPMLVNFT